MAALDNLIERFKIPPIPVSLADKYMQEKRDQADQFADFLLKYIGWVLVLIFSVVDFSCRPQNLPLILLTRLTIIPSSIILYVKRNAPFFKKHPGFRIKLIWTYGAILLFALVLLNLDPQLIYPYSCAEHLSAVVLVLFLHLEPKECLMALSLIYIPYLILIAVVNYQFVPYIFVVIAAFVISLALFSDSILRTKAFAKDFLNRQTLVIDAQIGENISQISHDTRAPLTALKALQEGLFDPEESRTILKKSVGRLIELVEDITQSASSLQLNIQKNDLNTFFQDCKEYVEFLHPDRKFEWELKLGSSDYFFDKNKIKRVLINLINNAVRASSLTKAPINITCNYTKKFEVTVQDTGEGFESSSDLFKKGISKFGGSGLGLHFCQQVVHEHGGSIYGTHENGITTFKFSI